MLQSALTRDNKEGTEKGLHASLAVVLGNGIKGVDRRTHTLRKAADRVEWTGNNQGGCDNPFRT